MARIDKKYIPLIALGVLIAILAALAVDLRRSSAGESGETYIAQIDNLSPEEVSEMRRQENIDDLIAGIDNFGIISTSGYINLRSEPNQIDMTNIIGKLTDGAALDIIEEYDEEWSYVDSGGLRGYCASRYILTGDEARDYAEIHAAIRAVITTDALNIRSAPEIDPQNVIAKAREGERYVLISRTGDWANIEAETSRGEAVDAYINVADGNAEIYYCLNTARRLDLRTMALSEYDNLVLAVAEGYINIREEPVDDGINNICGKFMEGSGGELLESVKGSDGNTWYRIKSGDVTGYVRADYCLTGKAAEDKAIDYARLTAYINVDALNVRSSPSTDAKVWTSVTKNQAYDVIDQLDGWVEIELDSGDGDEGGDRAFVSTRDNNVEVRYGLPEAVEYYPAVEAANAAAAFRNSIVNFAVQYVGGRYVWGGTTLGVGVDCSGFVMRVYEHFGISLPRTSRDQAKSGVRVTSDTMKPGDLVFYANSSGTVNHVAIYIGNGQVISAASQKSGIKIARWNYRTPVAIRNVIGD